MAVGSPLPLPLGEGRGEGIAMRRPPPRSAGLLVTYLRPQARRVGLLLALLLLGIGLDLGNPLIMRAFIDTASAESSGSASQPRG